MRKKMSKKLATFWLLLLFVLQSIEAQQNSSQLTPTQIANTSNSTAWLPPFIRFANQSAHSKIVRLENDQPPPPRRVAGYAIEVSPPTSNFQYLPATRSKELPEVVNNRSTRTANVNFDDSTSAAAEHQENLFVSNACERDFMLVEVKSSGPFYGLIHTLDHRRKLICTTEGDGGTHYKLTISHALNPYDPQHCGVTRLMRQQDRERDILSVILAIRSNRNIELSEDKFFALNCTNRCRRPDCSSGQLAIGRLVGELQAKNSNGWRALEREATDLQLPNQQLNKQQQQDNCAPWRPPWLVAALVCLSIVLLGMLVSNCIICMALKASERRAIEVERRQDGERESAGQKTGRRSASASRRQQINYENDAQLEPYEPKQRYEQQRSHNHHHHHHQNNNTGTKSRVVATKSYR